MQLLPRGDQGKRYPITQWAYQNPEIKRLQPMLYKDTWNISFENYNITQNHTNLCPILTLILVLSPQAPPNHLILTVSHLCSSSTFLPRPHLHGRLPLERVVAGFFLVSLFLPHFVDELNR